MNPNGTWVMRQGSKTLRKTGCKSHIPIVLAKTIPSCWWQWLNWGKEMKDLYSKKSASPCLFALTRERTPCQRNKGGGRLWNSRCSLILLVPELALLQHPDRRKHVPSQESVVPVKWHKRTEREKRWGWINPRRRQKEDGLSFFLNAERQSWRLLNYLNAVMNQKVLLVFNHWCNILKTQKQTVLLLDYVQLLALLLYNIFIKYEK